MTQPMSDRRSRTAMRLAIVAGMALLSGPPGLDAQRSAAVTVPPVPTPGSLSEPLVLRRMVAACTVSMANNLCSVAKAAASDTATPRATPAVFVVGSGAIDRSAYAYLQDGGKTMCDRAKSACSTHWSGTVCTAARSLWSD